MIPTLPFPCLMLLVLFLVVGAFSKDCTWVQVGETKLENGALFLLNEGITNDGSYYYMTGQQSIIKQKVSDLGARAYERFNKFPIPAQYTLSANYNHIGDIVYLETEGTLYAPIENSNHMNGSVFIYNAANLEFINSYFTPQKHFPWVAYHNGFMYSSEFNNVTSLYVYTLQDNFKLHSMLKIDRELQAVQGGEFWNGKLYLTLNPPAPNVVSVNVTTGQVKTEIPKPIEPEAEGITFVDLGPTGGVMHIMNGHHVQAGFHSSIFHWACKTPTQQQLD